MKEFAEANSAGGVRHDRTGDDLPRPGARRLRWKFPFVWLTPLVAALLAGYLVYDQVHEFGPQVTIRFKDVNGLEAGRTLLKYRGVPVGEVTAIRLGPDLQHALVTVRLHRSAAGIARKDSVFWIVHPEVGLGNITGLRTVITGPEIGVQPGSGSRATEFVGLDNAPATTERRGLSIILRTRDVGASLIANAPVYYRGVEVGLVQAVELGSNASTTDVRVLIHPRYAKLVHADSRFWKVGGVDVNFGLFSGLRINVESLRSLITGGVAFATPSARNAGASSRPAASGTVFPLFDKPEQAWQAWAPEIAIEPEPAPQG